jgi:hypothetical protein
MIRSIPDEMNLLIMGSILDRQDALFTYGDDPIVVVDCDYLPGLEQLASAGYVCNSRDTIFARYYCSVRQNSACLGNKAKSFGVCHLFFFP